MLLYKQEPALRRLWLEGWREMDGADVLMPYWMGRYYGFIVSE